MVFGIVFLIIGLIELGMAGRMLFDPTADQLVRITVTLTGITTATIGAFAVTHGGVSLELLWVLIGVSLVGSVLGWLAARRMPST